MSESANLASIAAVAEFRAALQTFQDDAAGALMSVDQHIQRVLHWFDSDGPAWWKQEIRNQYDAVAEARNALNSCQMRVIDGQEPTCYEEKKKYAAARRKLEAAEQKLKLVKSWGIKLHREIDEYRAQIGRLRHNLEGEVPQTLELLRRTTDILEHYAESTRPADSSAPASPASGMSKSNTSTAPINLQPGDSHANF